MYKIYKAKITQFGIPAIVIVDSFKNPGGYFRAESFCIFPPPHAEHEFKSLRFGEKSFENSSIELDDDFMIEEALAQAQIDISLHIEQHYSEKTFVLLQGELKIQEANIRFLAHQRVRDTADFLWDILKYTECAELRAALEPIINLPAIVRQKL